MAINLRFRRGTEKNPALVDGELYINTETSNVHVGPTGYVSSSHEINYSAMSAHEREVFGLYNRDGVLVDYHGNPVRAMGFATGPNFCDMLYDFGFQANGLLKPTWEQKRGADSFIYNLRRMAAYGVDHIVITLPYYNLDTYNATYVALGADEYYRRINQVLQVAYDCGVSVQVMVFTGEDTHLEIWGQAGDDHSYIEDTSHPVYVGWQEHLTELIRNIASSKAISSWQLTDEWNFHAELGQNGMTPARLLQELKLIQDVIAAEDTYNRITFGGGANSAGTMNTFDQDLTAALTHDTYCSGFGQNQYANGHVVNDSFADWRDTLVEKRRRAHELGKPFISTATGIARTSNPRWGVNTTYNDIEWEGTATYQGSDGGYGWDRAEHLLAAYRQSGTQLALWWQLARNANTDPFYVSMDVHPDNTENNMDHIFRQVADANLELRAEGYVHSLQIPQSKFSEQLTDASLRLPGDGSLSYSGISLKHTSAKPAEQLWDGFTVAFWLYVDNAQNLATTANRQIIIDTIDYTTNNGFQIYIGDDGRLNCYFLHPNGSEGINTYGDMVTDGWNHFVVQLDRWTFSTWRNGKKINYITHYTGSDPGNSAVRNFPAWTMNSTNLSVGASRPGGGNAYMIGNIKDLTIFNRPLSDLQMWHLYMHDYKPQDAVSQEFLYETDMNSTSGSTPTVVGTAALDNSFVYPAKTIR